ncbi:endonuclease/exonuclease/phosphatase family protein [Psychroflexus sp. CAK1W]|uniref:endonuclease/exonuclease/phosphatase family protein n=1 Tax=Psychroflexus curvus TaxID=2873595 RepID=UPI001CC99842|nr:endonuclease/exonuclease/phosphatase family protein [Psychroflexus curvus]MBZ9628169.1 endonuclease/exonuclease/phosphatase family protein [Psychroflexus curvus]
MFKISTWNIERPKSNTKKTKLVLDKIAEEKSDIIALTETSKAIDLSNVYPYSISTLAFERTPNEHWVTIWSKWEILEQISTFDNNRTVSGVIKAPFGDFIMYGTIIPYHMAGVSGIRYGSLNYKAWEYHEKDLVAQSQDWSKIMQNYSLPIIIAGDFNQTRFGNKGYGTKKVRALLTDILKKLNMTCVTEIDFAKEHLTADPKKQKIRKNIDHICISNELLAKMKNKKAGAWNHFTTDGKFMSDHNGVYFEFERLKIMSF